MEPTRSRDQVIKLQSINDGQFTQQSSFSFINEQKTKPPENSIQSELMERVATTPMIEGLSSILETDGHPPDFGSGVKQY